MNYVELLLILASAFTGCVSISVFASVFGILVGITSSEVGLKICVITTGIKKYKGIVKRKRKKHDEIVFSIQSMLNIIEVLISKALTDSYISHDEFISISIVLKEYWNMKGNIRNPNKK